MSGSVASTLSAWQRAQNTGWWQYAQALPPEIRIEAAWLNSISSWVTLMAPVVWQSSQYWRWWQVPHSVPAGSTDPAGSFAAWALRSLAIAAERNAQAKGLPKGSVEPAGTDCGSCHQRQYCEDCHTTGAIKVTHDEMLYNHAKSIRVSGGRACAYCHQPVFCATCHTGNPLETPADKTTSTTS